MVDGVVQGAVECVRVQRIGGEGHVPTAAPECGHRARCASAKWPATSAPSGGCFVSCTTMLMSRYGLEKKVTYCHEQIPS